MVKVVDQDLFWSTTSQNPRNDTRVTIWGVFMLKNAQGDAIAITVFRHVKEKFGAAAGDSNS